MMQTTDTVLMIRPAAFRSNPETAGSNAFQDLDAMPPAEAAGAAVAEFEAAVTALGNAGVRVIVVEDDPDPPRPDAIFPNNWLSTHEDGSVVLYPMLAPSRRNEVRPEIVTNLVEDGGYSVSRVLDLTGRADDGRFLEGTGSMVLDRVNGIAFACRSPRTNPEVLDEFCRSAGFRPHVFSAHGRSGIAIYHTNVQMWIGTEVAAVCLEAVGDARERAALREALQVSGRELVELSFEQMASFAGNMLELRGTDGAPVLAMSASAHAALDEDQLQRLRTHATLVVAGIPSIEACSGGSLRCMLAEIFLPRRVG
jgi:hypothetical protein